MNILANFGMIEKKQKPIINRRVPVLEYKKFHSDYGGIFIPWVKPLEKIQKEQKIGTITSIVNFQRKEIISPKAGIITTIQPKGVIRVGTKLFTIGKKIGEI